MEWSSFLPPLLPVLEYYSHRHQNRSLQCLLIWYSSRAPIIGTSPPDSDYRWTREPAIVGALTLIAPPNTLGENPQGGPGTRLAGLT